METEAFSLSLPQRQDTAVIFSSPHSGQSYSEAFQARSRLDFLALRSSEDAFVDQLFSPAPMQGAPLLAAKAPRAYVDLNRAVEELDPAVIEGVGRQILNPRISSGLGVIPRVVAGGRPIYSGKISRDEAESRLIRHWHPYHQALRGLVEENLRRFGQAILFDCHSMPHEALALRGRGGDSRADIVLGDRYGACASRDLFEATAEIFTREGLRVARNVPFAGGYITQSYGRPVRGQHAIQIEIDRALYMDEARIEKRADFGDFAALIARVVAQLVQLGRAERQRIAAE